MNKMRVILFGMTGFGNSAFKALRSSKICELIGVFAPKKHDAGFPYYDCEQLQDAVKKNNVNLYEGLVLKDEKTRDIIRSLSPDLIIVSSFNQIVPQAVISLPMLGVINIHPSLLPKYRGATPTVWAIMNGEEETGVTAHFIDDEGIDSGRIILQERLRIEPMDTDGSLRFKLAGLSERVLRDAVNLVMTREKESFPLQNESDSTYYSKRMLRDAAVDIDITFRNMANKIRAMYPYPGAYLEYGGQRHTIVGVSFPKGERIVIGNNIQSTEVVIDAAEGKLKFYVKAGDNGKEN